MRKATFGHYTRRSLAVALTLLASRAGAQVPTVRLDRPTAAPAEGFTKITAAVELSANRVLVADEKETRLTIIDLTTGAAQTIGRKGAGPGEYRYTERLLPRPGGGAYLADFAQRRLLPVTNTGTFEAPIAYPPGSMQLRSIDARGVIYADAFLPRIASGLPDSMWILRWDPATPRVDTLMKYDAAVAAMIVHAGEKLHAWAPRDGWQASPTGDIVLAHAVTYATSRWSAGRRARITPVPSEAVRVTDAEKDAFTREMNATPVQTMGQTGATPSAHPRMEIAFPTTMAPFENEEVKMAPDGRLWIGRLRAAHDSMPRYDVIDATNGALLAHVVFPPRTSIVGFGAGAVFVAERDQDDIMRIRRYASPTLPSR